MDKFSHKKGMYGHAGKDDAEWQPKERLESLAA